jgi:hypothetical protein
VARQGAEVLVEREPVVDREAVLLQFHRPRLGGVQPVLQCRDRHLKLDLGVALRAGGDRLQPIPKQLTAQAEQGHVALPHRQTFDR